MLGRASVADRGDDLLSGVFLDVVAGAVECHGAVVGEDPRVGDAQALEIVKGYVTGPLFPLVDLETVLLQKLGPACVAAYNASAMCADLPKVAFLAMDARPCAGAEMAEMMAYAASIGSAHARAVAGATMERVREAVKISYK